MMVTWRGAEERGFTLVETLITMAILGTVLASVYALLFSVQRGYNWQVNRADNLVEAHMAINRVQHELLSARAVTVNDCPSTDTTCSKSGNTMDAYTRTSEPTRTGLAYPDTSDISVCVQWKLDETKHVLLSRRWTPPWSNKQGTPQWTLVATGIRNSASKPLFAIDQNSAYAGRLVTLRPLVNVNPKTGSDVEVSASILGRNIAYQVIDPCATSRPPT